LHSDKDASDASDIDPSNSPPEPAVRLTTAHNPSKHKPSKKAVDIHFFFKELNFPSAEDDIDKVQKVCMLCM